MQRRCNFNGLPSALKEMAEDRGNTRGNIRRNLSISPPNDVEELVPDSWQVQIGSMDTIRARFQIPQVRD